MTDIKSAHLRLKRIKWKREPTEVEVQRMKFGTLFGPSCFERGDEWLFVQGDGPFHAETPKGYKLISGRDT